MKPVGDDVQRERFFDHLLLDLSVPGAFGKARLADVSGLTSCSAHRSAALELRPVGFASDTPVRRPAGIYSLRGFLVYETSEEYT